MLHRFWAVMLACLGLSAPLAAQDAGNYPTRPIRLIVGFAPGGATDTLARLLTEPLGTALGQSVVVENRPGANGYLAWSSVATADPDGYTILLGENALGIRPSLVKNGPPFDPLTQLEPIASIAYSPLALVISNKVQAKTVQELAALSKASPTKLNFASAGHGSVTHLTWEVVKEGAGIEAVTVNYRGGGPAMNDLIAGHMDMNMAASAVAKPLVEAGSIKALAVTGKERSPALPNVPTLAEAGVKHYDVDLRFWFGLFGPKNLPASVKQKLEKAVETALSTPAFRQRLLGLDITPDFAQASVLRSRLENEIKNWGEFINAKGITAE